MASKRDQLQAYQFLVQRTVSALVTRDTDPERPPFRRAETSAFAGIAVALVALAFFGVYGLIVAGGDTSWRRQPAVIVEKETGTRYVYLNEKLYPVTNYASALLLLGDHRPTERVSRDSLVGVPRGPRVGIPDAPDALPDRKRLLTGAWSLCTVPASDQSGARVEESVLLVGEPPRGGADLGEQGLLVELVPTGDRYLVWRGHRHRINDYPAVGTGLALGAESWARAGRAWLDVLPEGAAIGALTPAGAGGPSEAVPGRPELRIGALLVVRTSTAGQQYYLAEKDALRPITDLQYDIQRAAAGDAVSLAPSAVAAARQLDPVPATVDAAPAARPPMARLRDREATVCATVRRADEPPRLVLDPGLPASVPTARRSDTGTPLADRVYVPPGWAAVVEAMPAPGAPAGTLTVVTDQGRRYPLATPEVLRMLGYAGVRPVRLPAGLVARLPEGPGLDPQVAGRPV